MERSGSGDDVVEGDGWSDGLVGQSGLASPRAGSFDDLFSDGSAHAAGSGRATGTGRAGSARRAGSPGAARSADSPGSGRPARGASEGEAARGKAAAQTDPVQQAKEICLRLLTVRPRTRVELGQALARKGVEAEVAEQVLSRFDQVGLIDDAAFAEMWVRSRHGFQGLSRRALAVELRRKGVADESAAEALATVDSEAEEERARQLVRKRLRSLGAADEPTKVRKLVGMLARKGYSEGLAYRVVKDEVRTSLLDDTF